MKKLFFIVFLFFLGTSGCTLRQISMVNTEFPSKQGSQMKCITYCGSLEKVAQCIREMELLGWTTKLVGHEHQHVLGILTTSIVVCYEKSHPREQTPNNP